MQVTLISNFLNHHQAPFCDEMYKILGDDFKFISIHSTPPEFIDNGYEDCSDFIYNIKSFQDANALQLSQDLLYKSDVVIFGEAPYHFIKPRLNANKLTFKYAERLFKEGSFQLFNPKKIYHILNRHTRYRNKNLHLLSASAFTPNDFQGFLTYPGKKYKWGYFTSVNELDIDDLLRNKNQGKIKIIWVARFIKLKHPELVVNLASNLKRKGFDFQITMIGQGDLWEKIKVLVVQKDLENEISLPGSISNQKVREEMLNSEIFLFTSDRNEGWGAVLNEAMSSGCASIASEDIGAAPYLIKDGENGLLFKTNNIEDLTSKVIQLLDNDAFRFTIAKKAYLTMRDLWSPKNAAKQFINLAESILLGKKIIPDEGPCSIAEITKCR